MLSQGDLVRDKRSRLIGIITMKIQLVNFDDSYTVLLGNGLKIEVKGDEVTPILIPRSTAQQSFAELFH